MKFHVTFYKSTFDCQNELQSEYRPVWNWTC